MSSGNAHQDRLHDELDAAIQENTPTGKLEDAEIQRLVQLSNDASYQRSERVPVKTVEAFEPRSLVSIAMAAQRRRESELRTAAAAGAAIDEDGAGSPDAAIGSDVEAAGDAASQADQMVADEADAPEVSADAAAEMAGDGEAPEEGAAEEAPSSTSQVDFEAGHAEGLEEGRRVGHLVKVQRRPARAADAAQPVDLFLEREEGLRAVVRAASAGAGEKRRVV